MINVKTLAVSEHKFSMKMNWYHYYNKYEKTCCIQKPTRSIKNWNTEAVYVRWCVCTCSEGGEVKENESNISEDLEAAHRQMPGHRLAQVAGR